MPPHDHHLRRIVGKTRRIPSRIGGAPAYVGRFARALAADPVETLRSVPESVSSHLFDVTVEYSVEEDFGPAFHALLGLPWPCDEIDAFRDVWARHRARPGNTRTSLRSLDLWGVQRCRSCLGCRHLVCRSTPPSEERDRDRCGPGCDEPTHSRGHALNGCGHLWSVDLPHPLRPELHHETAAAVPLACREQMDVCPRFEPETASVPRGTPREGRHVRA